MSRSSPPSPALTRLPPQVHAAGDYEDLAAQFLDGAVYAHLAGGAGRDVTARLNRAAFDDLTITPRLLRDVAQGHTRLTLAGEARPHPILLAPVAFQGLFHPRGELEVARGAAAAQAGLICSTLSSFALEEIAGAAGPDRWFQLYVQPDREVTLDLVRRAEAAGFRALVVTLDTPVLAPGLGALRAGFRGEGCVAANLAAYPPAEPRALAPGESRIFQGIMSAAPTWADVDWLRAQTSLPLWVKGVMHPDDAQACLRRGADGVVVSNHGGRSLDGAPASLGVLPAVRAAVGPDAPVLFDGGVRSGADVFKAVALGADAVLVGRLQACALSVAGALGVGHMVKLLREELELCMALAGCATLDDIRTLGAAQLGGLARLGDGEPC